MYPVRRQISPHAAPLRRNMTDVERMLWQAIRARQLLDFKFRRQATIGPFIVDFLCVETKLIVELDGGQHDAEQDAPRTAFLEAKGYQVMRIWNHEVVENFDGVIVAITAMLDEGRKTLTQPSPAKAGEG